MSVVASAKDLKDEAGTSVVAAVSLVDPDVPEVQHYPPNTTTKQKMKDACLLDIFTAPGLSQLLGRKMSKNERCLLVGHLPTKQLG